MSLGRLLAAGKSLVGLSGDAGRYRVDKRARLPKFISPKNPFAAGEAPALSPDPASQPEAQKAGAVLAPPETSDTEKQFSLARMSVRATGWLAIQAGKIKLWSRRWLLRGSEKQEAPRGDEPALQGELSLDAIRVVRNDLSDTDFEIVRRSDAKSASPLIAMTAEKLEPVGAVWSRLSNRFFDVDHT